MNNIGDDMYGAYYDGLRDGSPKWVKTADRLPTEADARENGCLPCVLSATQYAVTDGVHEKVFTFYDVKTIGEVATTRNLFTRSVYWMPLPKLPEVEG